MNKVNTKLLDELKEKLIDATVESAKCPREFLDFTDEDNFATALSKLNFLRKQENDKVVQKTLEIFKEHEEEINNINVNDRANIDIAKDGNR